MNRSLTKLKEDKQLIELLTKTDKPPNTPFGIWSAINQFVPTPAIEVLVTRSGKDFLLVYRKDKYWDGWHIPGGFILAKESLGTACNRLSKNELGIDVDFKKVITVYAWPDHPYANAISIVCLCRPKGKPINGRFFTKIPNNMVPHHDNFVKHFLKLN